MGKILVVVVVVVGVVMVGSPFFIFYSKYHMMAVDGWKKI